MNNPTILASFADFGEASMIPTLTATPDLAGLRVIPISDVEVIRRTQQAYMLQGFATIAPLRSIMAGGHVVIVGGGPSARDDLAKISAFSRARGVVLAVNNAHDMLLENGIKPDMAMILETRERAAGYITPRGDVAYVVATTVHEKTLDVFRQDPAVMANTLLFHAEQDDAHARLVDSLNDAFTNKIPRLPGSVSVGLRAADLAVLWMEAGVISLFGFDSSGTPDLMHAKAKAHPTPPSMVMQIRAPDGRMLKRQYPTTPQMHRQAGEFWRWRDDRAKDIRDKQVHPFDIRMYGRGLLPDLAAMRGFHVDSERIKAELVAEGFDTPAVDLSQTL